MYNTENYFKNQDLLRGRVIQCMKLCVEKKTSLGSVAKDAKLARRTLDDFIQGRQATWAVLTKLEKWCNYIEEMHVERLKEEQKALLAKK